MSPDQQTIDLLLLGSPYILFYVSWVIAFGLALVVHRNSPFTLGAFFLRAFLWWLAVLLLGAAIVATGLISWLAPLFSGS